MDWIRSLLGWALALTLPASALAQEGDRDGDGLSDYHEVHKYRSDPDARDSDRDGVDDGDWGERREWTYTVRAVVQAMKPVTLEELNDDFQDVRKLDEGDDYVEFEVVLYPFSTVNEEIQGHRSWKRVPEDLQSWLEPGPTSDWTADMRRDLLAALGSDGIDVAKLDDKAVVEQVSAWLMDHADYHDGFSSFITAFDEDGKPFVPEELQGEVQRGSPGERLSLEEQWRCEISARGMFETGRRGSCTSSAIYLSGCLRAVGIPTRTILCIPLVDAGDSREREMLEERLQHNLIRPIVVQAAEQGRNAWTSHTFNEVWVGGRWRRLNYNRLGQGILDEHYLGLMIHIGTFHDWADARMPETVGRRHRMQTQSQLFGGANPYSTLTLRDEFGVHSGLENPRPEPRDMVVHELRWTDDSSLPADIVSNCAERGRYGLIARMDETGSFKSLSSFLAGADLRVWLESEGQPRIGIGFDPQCWWYLDGIAYVYMPFGIADRRDFVEGVDYAALPRNGTEGFTWRFESGVRR